MKGCFSASLWLGKIQMQAGQRATFARKWQQRCDAHLVLTDLGSERGWRAAHGITGKLWGLYTHHRRELGAAEQSEAAAKTGADNIKT